MKGIYSGLLSFKYWLSIISDISEDQIGNENMADLESLHKLCWLKKYWPSDKL